MRSLNTLYVIDDDLMCQYIAKSVIGAVGVTRNISVFSNGREALDAIERDIDAEEKLPDMILLDIMMPVLDGWGFLENYKQLKPRVGKDILIYLVTTSNNPVDMERAKNIGDVKGYMVKPITRQKYLDLIQQGSWQN